VHTQQRYQRSVNAALVGLYTAAGLPRTSLAAGRCQEAYYVTVSSSALKLGRYGDSLFHDLLLRSYLYRCVWSVIAAHNLTPEKRDNNYSPHPLTPASCLRNNIQLITGISHCCGCM